MPEPWEPDPEEVHALIPQRAAGREFSANTIPTLTQVQEIIADVLIDVKSFVGDEIPEPNYDLAELTVKYGAAMAIESALHPEGSTRDDSMYAELKAEYEKRLDRLAKIVGDRKAAEHAQGGPRGVFPTPNVAVSDEFYRPLGSLGS